MYLGSAVLLSVACAMCRADRAADIDQLDPAKLTIAENVYVTFSSACRALMGLKYSTDAGSMQGEVLKNMRILYLDRENIFNLHIDDTFAALTNPSLYDITRQTKVVIHWFNDHAQSDIPMSIARAYNEKNIFNVLLVDAGDIIKERYLHSVHYAQFLGRRLANLLVNLEEYGAPAADVHVIGISLGAHVAGWAGKYFRKYKARRLGRITGLDPAGPCYTHAGGGLRLDRDDADYVDVVHVNRLVQGVLEPLGHADFYVNGGGPHQPGCLSPSCSHQRAGRLFEESVRSPKAFVGVKCGSWKEFESGTCDGNQLLAVMGYGSSSGSRGVFYLRTAAETPFGLSMNGTKAK